MRRISFLLVAALAGLPACGGGSSSGSSESRTVLTDFNHDEFATAYLGNFPTHVKVHAGDTIDFKQAWTGEPHTVTMGQIVQPLGTAMSPYFDGTRAVPEEEPEDIIAASKDIPQFFDETDVLNQAAAQPCFLEKGPLPTEKKACPQIKQPVFNGRQAFYNSGFIPYSGNNGNRFRVELANDIAVGNYFYFCLIHGAPMGGYIEVRPDSENVPSQSAVNKAARTELDAATKRLTKAHNDATAGKDKKPGVDVQSDAAPEVFAFPDVFTLEFYPSTFKAKVGQKVTWNLNGHTVSFNVPKYGPQVIVEKDGTVKLNPKAYKAVNAPEPPATPDGPPGPPGPPPQVDAGAYVPGKFISSGSQDNELFSLTFTKAGTYKYACLIHPRMIGTVVVSK